MKSADSRYRDAVSYWSYQSKVWKRAVRDAWRIAIAHSPVELVRNTATVLLTAALLLFVDRGANLVARGVISSTSVWDMVFQYVLLTFVSPFLLFAALVIVERLLFASHKLWKEECARAALIDTSAPDDAVMSAWADQDPLTLYQAAALWVGEAPPRRERDELSEAAHVAWVQLSNAASKRELPISASGGTELERTMNEFAESMCGAPIAKPGSLVKRANLRALAEKRGKRPVFLFGAASDVTKLEWVSLVDATRYVGEASQWAKSCSPLMEVWNEYLRRAIHDALGTGDLKARGRKAAAGGVHSRFSKEPIEQSFWPDAYFGALDQVLERLDANTAYSMDGGDKKPAFIDVELRTEDLRRLWPPLTVEQSKDFVSPVKRIRDENETQRQLLRPV